MRQKKKEETIKEGVKNGWIMAKSCKKMAEMRKNIEE